MVDKYVRCREIVGNITVKYANNIFKKIADIVFNPFLIKSMIVALTYKIINCK